VIPILEPLFQGAWAPYGETLQCVPQPPARAIPVAELLHNPSHLLEDALQRHARHLGVMGQGGVAGAGCDLRAAASAWSLDYLRALLTPVAAAASLLYHCFPVSAEHVAVTLDESGRPVCFHIPNEGTAMPGSSTAARYGALLWQHLDPLFVALSRHTRLARKILWGNAARHLETVFDQALLLAGPAPHVALDRDTLLQSPAWPDGRPNPLHAPRRQVIRMQNGSPLAVNLHRQCCLCYLLPGQNYCGACPLMPPRPGLKAVAPRAEVPGRG